MNHPNLPYGNPNTALMPPPGYFVTNGVIYLPKKIIVAEVFVHYMEANILRVNKMESAISGIWSKLANQDKHNVQITQLSQIAQYIGVVHKPGQFPRDTILLKSGTQ